MLLVQHHVFRLLNLEMLLSIGIVAVGVNICRLPTGGRGDDVGFNLTETVDLEELPVGRPLRARERYDSPEKIVLKLSSAQRLEDVIRALSE
ncbi:hypothetical protein [Natrinema salinisoli]|uniref:hypothetical protein n=1 Tax=Natrinema salinisoli TaxID=2878535 RepID=UPI001CF08FD2|nr:hypothetical protein [Natrinema salinisoli]